MQFYACSAHNSLIKILFFRTNNPESSTSYSRNNLFFWLYHHINSFQVDPNKGGVWLGHCQDKTILKYSHSIIWQELVELPVVLPAGSEWLLLVNCLSPSQWLCVKPPAQNPTQSGFCSQFHPSSTTHWLFTLLLTEKRPLPSQILPSPNLGHLHLLLRRNTPFPTGVFCYAHQIKPPETHEESLTAASLLAKQERQFPSHTKGFHGIAANPFVLSRNLKSKENNVAPFVLIHSFKGLNNQQGGLSSLHAQNSPQMLKLIGAATGDVHRLIYRIWEVTQIAAVIVNVLYYYRDWVRICDDQLQRSSFPSFCYKPNLHHKFSWTFYCPSFRKHWWF